MQSYVSFNPYCFYFLSNYFTSFLVWASASLNTWSCPSIRLSVPVSLLPSYSSHDVVVRWHSDYGHFCLLKQINVWILLTTLVGCCTILYGFVLLCLALYGPVRSSTVFLLSCAFLCGPVWSCTGLTWVCMVFYILFLYIW